MIARSMHVNWKGKGVSCVYPDLTHDFWQAQEIPDKRSAECTAAKNADSGENELQMQLQPLKGSPLVDVSRCSSCNDLYIRKPKLFAREDIHMSISDVEKTAAGGCSICSFLLEAVRDFDLVNLLSKHLSASWKQGWRLMAARTDITL